MEPLLIQFHPITLVKGIDAIGEIRPYCKRGPSIEGIKEMTVSKEDIMTAIVALKGHLDGRIDGLRNELKGDIARLDAKIDTKIDGLRTELKGDIAEHRAETRTEARGIQARLDDQSRMLANMIPTRLAAVPPRDAA